MKAFRTLAIALLTLLVCLGIASSQEPTTSKWQKLTNAPSFDADTPLLLTDGTVMVHQYSSNKWWRLTPDVTGSYVNGTWSALASMSSSYAPLYFASAVLADGNVIVEGGEYNNLSDVETNLGAYLQFLNQYMDLDYGTLGLDPYWRWTKRRPGQRDFHAGKLRCCGHHLCPVRETASFAR